MRPLIFLLAATLPAADRTLVSQQPVGQVVFSDDGKTLAGICSDRKIRIWDTATGELKSTTAAESGSTVAIGPGAKLAATGAKDGTIRVVNLKDGEMMQRLTGHKKRPRVLAFSQDGKMLASGVDEERALRVWDLAKASQTLTLEDGIGGAADLAFSPAGDLLAGSNFDANVRVWNLKTGALVRVIDELLVSVFSLAFSPDGTLLAGAGVDQTVYLWNTATWKLERKLEGQPEMISSLAFSPDGRYLLTGGFDSATVRNPVKVMLWDVQSGSAVRTLASQRRVASVAFSPDSKRIAMANQEKSVVLWEVSQ